MLGRAGVRRDRTRIPKVPIPAARWFGSSLNVQAPPREGRQRSGAYTLRRVWLHAVPPEETVSEEKMRDAVVDLIVSAESPA